jgi:hypothetical protein
MYPGVLFLSSSTSGPQLRDEDAALSHLARKRMVESSRGFIASGHLALRDLPLRLKRTIHDAYIQGQMSCHDRLRELEHHAKRLEEENLISQQKITSLRVGMSHIPTRLLRLP